MCVVSVYVRACGMCVPVCICVRCQYVYVCVVGLCTVSMCAKCVRAWGRCVCVCGRFVYAKYVRKLCVRVRGVCVCVCGECAPVCEGEGS